MDPTGQDKRPEKFKVKHDKELKLAIEAKRDFSTGNGTSTRFIYGDPNSAVNGSIYIRSDEVIPGMLIIMFKLKEGEYIPTISPKEDKV